MYNMYLCMIYHWTGFVHLCVSECDLIISPYFDYGKFRLHCLPMLAFDVRYLLSHNHLKGGGGGRGEGLFMDRSSLVPLMRTEHEIKIYLYKSSCCMLHYTHRS